MVVEGTGHFGWFLKPNGPGKLPGAWSEAKKITK